MSPADVGGRFATAPQPLVRVHPLVGDSGHFGRVRQQARDERLADLGQLEGIGRVVEGVAVALEQRQVRVHRRPGLVAERLRHERRVNALLQRNLLDDEPHRHQVVCRRQSIGIAQIDLLLARRDLMVTELDADPHPLEHRDGLPAEVVTEVVRRLVEVATGVYRLRQHQLGRRSFPQEEELHLGMHVERKAEIGSLLHHPTKDVSWVGVRRRAVRHQDVAVHPRRTRCFATPRQHLERRRVGSGEHVRLVHTREALDRGTVEADAFGERAFELGRSDRDRLQEAEHVCEPEPDEADVPFLDRPQDELLLSLHVITLRRRCYATVSKTQRSSADVEHGDELVERLALADDCVSTELLGRLTDRGRVVRGVNDDHRVRTCPAKRRKHVDAVTTRHPVVEHDGSRPMLGRKHQRPAGIRSREHH